MPLTSTASYRPPFWLPTGHLQTIFPTIFRKSAPVISFLERIVVPENDFLDLVWGKKKGNEFSKIETLVILCHGLEGNVNSQYIMGMINHLTNNGFDCLAWNFRGCGTELNRNARFYHSGATEDLDMVVQHAVHKGYKKIHLIGFSLGGNLILKYLGERSDFVSPVIGRAVTFSAPLDLEACSLSLLKFENRFYMQRFLKSLKIKIHQKAALFPNEIDIAKYAMVKDLYDFDDIFTAPLHGFDNAKHYYTSCSSKFFVDKIKVKTLIINAKNDPFVPYESIPSPQIMKNENLTFEAPSQGGHCGFRQVGMKNNAYWSEIRALAFLNLEDLK